MSASQRPIVACPYYKYEKDGSVVCDGGKLDLLQNKKLRDDYVNGYCANINFNHCTIARTLTRHYESASEKST
jgi:hypothetical protein